MRSIASRVNSSFEGVAKIADRPRPSRFQPLVCYAIVDEGVLRQVLGDYGTRSTGRRREFDPAFLALGALFRPRSRRRSPLSSAQTQAQVVAARKQPSDYLSVAGGWGVGFMLAIYISSVISGGQINPAVTVSLAVFRRFKWSKVPGYVLAQLLGAFTAAAIIYGELFVFPLSFVAEHADPTLLWASTTARFNHWKEDTLAS